MRVLCFVAPASECEVWDGVTLTNGVTVLVIMVVFTDVSGDIVSTPVDIAACGVSHAGPHVASSVMSAISQRLGVPSCLATRTEP